MECAIHEKRKAQRNCLWSSTPEFNIPKYSRGEFQDRRNNQYVVCLEKHNLADLARERERHMTAHAIQIPKYGKIEHNVTQTISRALPSSFDVPVLSMNQPNLL